MTIVKCIKCGNVQEARGKWVFICHNCNTKQEVSIALHNPSIPINANGTETSVVLNSENATSETKGSETEKVNNISAGSELQNHGDAKDSVPVNTLDKLIIDNVSNKEEKEYFTHSDCGYDKLEQGMTICPNCSGALEW